MKKLILPILLALVGLGAGAGAGHFLRPAPAAEAPAEPSAEGAVAAEHGAEAKVGEAKPGEAKEAKAHEGEASGGHGAEGEHPATEYVKLNNQFIVPVVENGKVQSLVILSLSLEVTFGESAKVYAQEPKLRDGFLQVLFDHANAGGFDGSFTSSNAMDVLRAALLESAQSAIGPLVSGVLITDIVRQDN